MLGSIKVLLQSSPEPKISVDPWASSVGFSECLSEFLICCPNKLLSSCIEFQKKLSEWNGFLLNWGGGGFGPPSPPLPPTPVCGSDSFCGVLSRD